jgi:eukaryotic translation initiation factor 2C
VSRIHAFAVITPQLKNRARAIEIIDRLQNHVAPHVFQPPAIYDGRANLFSSHRLALSNGNSGHVRDLVTILYSN